MKRNIYLGVLVLFALVLCSYNRASAASITYHSFYDSCVGTSFYAMVSDSSGTNNMEISYGDGTTVTDPIAMGWLNTSHVYALSGTYTVKMVWIHNSVRTDSISFSVTHTGCGIMYGRLYHDNNSNCTYDAGDVLLSFPSYLEVDSAGTPIDTIPAYGTFYYKALGGGVSYSFKLLSSTSGMSASCPTSGTLTATSILYGTVNAGDLGFTCTSTSFDVAVNAESHFGRHSHYVYVELSTGSCTAKSGTLTVNFDSHYAFYGCSPSGSVSGHTVTFSYSHLSIDSPKYFFIHAEKSSPWLTPGTTTNYSAYIDHLSGDTNIANDTVKGNDTVTSSWDPNDKYVTPVGNFYIPTTRLTYTITFENTGNAPAKNISVLDTLDANIDPSTIQVITSSFPVKAYTFLNLVGGRTVMRFDFVNINLPDTSHHGQAEGFVRFSATPKRTIVNGTTINNRAGIYFDDNEVVMTKTVSNTYYTLGVKTVNMDEVLLYPNPVNNDLLIKANTSQYNHVTIINAMGQTMLQQSLQPNETHISTRSLIPGVYYIMLKGEGGTKVEKIEKL